MIDIHSYSQPQLLRVRHLDLDLDADFAGCILNGSATLHFEPATHGELVLDTRALTIFAVEHAAGSAAFELGGSDPVLGAPLRIQVPHGATWVRVHYATTPESSALQWCEPAQTAGRRQPFLYTQSQAIHARSWIPLQDTPGVRVTFTAQVRTPPGLTAVMGAEMDAGRFHMPQPVPSYLIALAVGQLEFRPLGPRSGVYAEPSVVEAAAAEFADTEAMIAAVEEMFGPYRWGRYDLLVLPPSFPFGGMENPRLTFATPTILAGDRSLVSLVAHELAHSWSGNLVTNATWSDFWLNEGFTVYLERRILEKIYGAERARMEAALARDALTHEMAALPPGDGILHIDLAGRDPDEGCTLVPYEKGALFLTAIERAAGRPRFDEFLRAYFDRFAFCSLTTAEFIDFLRRELPLEGVPVEEWIFAPGIPAGAPDPGAFVMGPDRSRWCTHEWLQFLRTTSSPLADLDRQHAFTQSTNSEILHEWLLMAVRGRYVPAFARLEEFLVCVGRRKYIKPLYAELVKTTEGREMARRIYAHARQGYHPIAQATIDQIVGRPG